MATVPGKSEMKIGLYFGLGFALATALFALIQGLIMRARKG
jgi:hypothetical protein